MISKEGQHTVFLSYAWSTKAIANRIYFDLIRSNVRVWKDDRSTEKAWEIWKKITSVIDYCDYFLLLDGVYARSISEWVPRECEYALELEKRGALKIVIALVDDFDRTHQSRELFQNHNERLFFDFSDLKTYDIDGKYKRNIKELCEFFDNRYVPWTNIPRDQDFEQELSAAIHLDTLNRDILIKDYEVFRRRYLSKFPTYEKRLLNLIEDCEVLKVNAISPRLALGVLQLEKEDFKGAYESFANMVHLFSNDPRAFMGLGGVQFYQGDYQAAIASYLKTIALIKSSGNENHLKQLQYVYRNLLETYLEAGQYEDALNIYVELDEFQKQLPEVKTALGRLYMLQNDEEKSIRTFEELFENSVSEEPGCYLQLANCYEYFSYQEKAIAILKQGMDECSENGDIGKKLAHLLFKKGAYPAAVQIYEKLKATGELQVYAELATLYFIMLKEAVYVYPELTRNKIHFKLRECYDFCEAFSPSIPVEYYLKGQVFYIKKKFKASRIMYEKCLEKDSTSETWHYYDRFILH